MSNKMSRARDKRVTHFLPLLIPAVGDEPKTNDLRPGTVTRVHGPDGVVAFQEGGATRIQPVKRFVRSDTPTKRFSAVAKLLSLAAGKKIDYSLLRDAFRTLLEDACGRPLAEAVAKEAAANPQKASARWLVPLFNHEIEAARLVMWWPRKSPIAAIYCPSDEVASFIDLLFSGVSACLGCGKLFTPHRPNQLFHDYLCAGRHRKRRERQKRK